MFFGLFKRNRKVNSWLPRQKEVERKLTDNEVGRINNLFHEMEADLRYDLEDEDDFIARGCTAGVAAPYFREIDSITNHALKRRK